jgi:rhamnulose-1-phosphate aldolase
MSYLYLSQLSAEVRDFITNCADVGSLLHEKDWAEGNGGNLSIRLESPIEKWWVSEETPQKVSSFPLEIDLPNLQEEFILIKAAGKRMRDIARIPDQTLCIGKVVEKEFLIYWPTKYQTQPSSEINTHLAIHNYLINNENEKKVILHTHPTELITISNFKEISDSNKLNYYLKSTNPGVSIYLPEGVGYVPFEIPSSLQLLEKTLKIINLHNLILWAKHGVICKGRNLMECFDLIDIANKSAKYLLATNQFTLDLLDEKTIEAIEDYFHKD